MTNPIEPPSDPLARLALLGEPVRRRVYEYVAGSSGPVDRDTVAAAVGISRSLAAFHLDRLIEGALLEATFRRRSGRTGPGAGRPAKFYARPAGDPIQVSLPPRRYEVAAQLFAAGLDRAAGGRAATLRAARDAGLAAAASVPTRVRRSGRVAARQALLDVLDARGFEPRPAPDGGVELGNCPFGDLTADHRDLTCGANLALLEALAGSFDGARLVAARREPPVPCCVTLRPIDTPDRLAASGS